MTDWAHRWLQDNRTRLMIIVIGFFLLGGMGLALDSIHQTSLSNLWMLHTEDILRIDVVTYANEDGKPLFSVDQSDPENIALFISAMNHVVEHSPASQDFNRYDQLHVKVWRTDGSLMELLLHQSKWCDTFVYVDIVSSDSVVFYRAFFESKSEVLDWLEYNGFRDRMGCP